MKVISISIDDGDAERPKVVNWSKQMKAGFPILHDAKGAAQSAFGINGMVPYNVVIDRAGKVVGTNTGDMDDLKKLVAKVSSPTRAPSRKRASR